MTSEPYVQNPITNAPISDLRHANTALQEELAAMVDYLERAASANSAELSQVFTHNAREEAEHAAYLIDWMSRHEPIFKSQLERILGRETADSASAFHELAGSGVRELKLDPQASKTSPLEVNHA